MYGGIVVGALTVDYGSETAPGKHTSAAGRFDAKRGLSTMARYALLITFGDKAKRDETRPQHREYLSKLFEQGKLVFSGPFADDEGALIMYECPDEAAARAQFAADPYSRAEGVIADAQIREWKQIFPAA